MADKDELRLGRQVPGWAAPSKPVGTVLNGRFVRLEPLRAANHAADLHAANRASDAIWDFLPYGPFDDLSAYADWVTEQEGSADPLFLAIVPQDTGRAAGVASYLRIAPQAGSIEVGHINLSPALQRSPAATEAMFLMMKWAFDAGYRRYEWKCNDLNAASRRAAERLGLSYEGIFRQAAVIKGRNRDTAWFAATDGDWQVLQQAFATWLSPENFDADGRQRQRLSDLTAPVLVTRDPGKSGISF